MARAMKHQRWNKLQNVRVKQNVSLVVSEL